MSYSKLLSHIYAKSAAKKLRPQLINTPYPCIHIAGSNGKGTVAWKIAESLKHEGLSVGLFTSPHISSFRERIRVNDELISEEEVLKKELNNNSSFFEFTTQLALSHFEDKKVDVAVIETGLGGEFDASNAVQPILSIITSLSLEHTEILGNTLEDIAKAKAGILKPHVPVVLGPRVPKRLIEPYAKKLECPIYQCQDSIDDNTLTAKLALEHLPFTITLNNPGLQARPPCRMELISHPSRTIILDVAHNPESLNYLFHQIRKTYPDRPLRCLFALSNKKPIAKCLKIVDGFTKQLILFDCPHFRLHPVLTLQTEAKKLNLKAAIVVDIQTFIEESSPNDVLIVCGSFFIMSEIRNQLGINVIRDPDDINEKLLR